MSFLHTEFSAWLERSGFSDDYFAGKCGLPLSVIDDFKNGRKPVPAWAIFICEIADAVRLQVPFPELCDHLDEEAQLEASEILGIKSHDDYDSAIVAARVLQDIYAPTANKLFGIQNRSALRKITGALTDLSLMHGS